MLSVTRTFRTSLRPQVLLEQRYQAKRFLPLELRRPLEQFFRRFHAGSLPRSETSVQRRCFSCRLLSPSARLAASQAPTATAVNAAKERTKTKSKAVVEEVNTDATAANKIETERMLAGKALRPWLAKLGSSIKMVEMECEKTNLSRTTLNHPLLAASGTARGSWGGSESCPTASTRACYRPRVKEAEFRRPRFSLPRA